MSHPSEYDPDHEEPEWPEGMSQEKAEAIIEKLSAELSMLGLYPDPRAFIERHGDTLSVTMNFQVGDVAFTTRVQNPEQDSFNDSFRQIETDNLRDRVEEIKEKFRRDRDE